MPLLTPQASTGLVVGAALLALTGGCKEAPKILDEPAPEFALNKRSGKAVDVPSLQRDQLLYFFASW
jgi:hypothetical protein